MEFHGGWVPIEFPKDDRDGVKFTAAHGQVGCSILDEQYLLNIDVGLTSKSVISIVRMGCHWGVNKGLGSRNSKGFDNMDRRCHQR